MARIQSQSVVEELSAATFTGTTGSTGTLVAGTTAGTATAVAGVYVSSASAMTVSIIDGTTAAGNLLWEMYTAAAAPGQSFVAPADEFLFTCTTGEDLTVISSTNGAVFVSVLYQVV